MGACQQTPALAAFLLALTLLARVTLDLGRLQPPIMSLLYDILSHYLFPLALIPLAWFLATYFSGTGVKLPEKRKGKKLEEFELTRIMVYPIKVSTSTSIELGRARD